MCITSGDIAEARIECKSGEDGWELSGTKCPVALALTRALAREKVDLAPVVGSVSIRLYRYPTDAINLWVAEWKMSKRMAEWVREWDMTWLAAKGEPSTVKFKPHFVKKDGVSYVT